MSLKQSKLEFPILQDNIKGEACEASPPPAGYLGVYYEISNHIR